MTRITELRQTATDDLKTQIKDETDKMALLAREGDYTTLAIYADSIKTLAGVLADLQDSRAAVAYTNLAHRGNSYYDDMPTSVQALMIADYAEENGVEPRSLVSPTGWNRIKSYL